MDGLMLVLNLGFLLPVTLLPFVTDLMGERRDHWVPVAVFAATNLGSVLALYGMWKHARTRAHLADQPQMVARADRIVLGLRVFIGVMVAGVLFALVDPRVGIACFALTPVAHFFNYARDALRETDEFGKGQGA
jgi:uncharacterized membrane protein